MMAKETLKVLFVGRLLNFLASLLPPGCHCSSFRYSWMIPRPAVYHLLYSCLGFPSLLLPCGPCYRFSLSASFLSCPYLFHFLHFGYGYGYDFSTDCLRHFCFCFDSEKLLSFFQIYSGLYLCAFHYYLSSGSFSCWIPAKMTSTIDCCKKMTSTSDCLKTTKRIDCSRRYCYRYRCCYYY